MSDAARGIKHAEFPAERDSVDAAVAFALQALGDLPEDVQFGFELALSEICGNLIRHGLAPPCEASSFSLRVARRADECVVEISDRGRRIPAEVLQRELEQDCPPPDPDDPATWAESGFGFPLIKEMMDRVSYTTDSRGNHLRISRRTGGAA